METLKTVKEEALKNPIVRAEYVALANEFALIEMLLEMRKNSGLTQSEIAKILGTSKGNISRLEKGSNTTVRTFLNYAAACGFKVSLKVEAL